MGNNKFCPNCGHPVHSEYRFCQECGSQLINTSTTHYEQQTHQEQSLQNRAFQNQVSQDMVVSSMTGQHDSMGSIEQRPYNIVPPVTQQPDNIVIDITPIEERQQYKAAMKLKRSMMNFIFASVITGSFFIYNLFSTSDGFFSELWRSYSLFSWGLVTIVCLFIALNKWNKHKELLEMSTKEYNEELQRKEKEKKETIQFVSGVVQGIAQSYIRENLRK